MRLNRCTSNVPNRATGTPARAVPACAETLAKPGGGR